MKTVRLLIAATLALVALVGVALALTWWQPVTARAEDAVSAPTAPQTLPPPYLSDDDVADAPYHRAPIVGPSTAVDGLIAPGEYAGAGKVAFPGYDGAVEVFFKQDGDHLYIAFDLPALDLVSIGAGNYADVYLDTGNDGGELDDNDYWLRVRDDGVTQEYTVAAGSWGQETAPISWTGAAATGLTGSGWQVEFAIEYSKLGLTPGTFKELGLALGTEDGGLFYWPSGADRDDPDTWGSLVSSSDWDTFYWKPGPWEDYAPSGMPDFDQKQDGWSAPGSTGPVSTHCGPVAMANSLWWFDSKFETPDHAPPDISDTYRLVWGYFDSIDDHGPENVIPLVDDLAQYFDTNGIRTGGNWRGTYATDMHSGTLAYLRDHGLWDDYIVTLVISPSFEWVADEVQRSEDVILLLGFWEWRELEERWARVGGHYVTASGVDPTQNRIAFSDPFVDNAEMGGAGRVLSGTLIPHTPIPHVTATLHNDAGNVSHDVYVITDTNSPGGTWGPQEYPWRMWTEPMPTFVPNGPAEPWQYGDIQVEVEFALAVSPYTWKASGYWNDADDVHRAWQPWKDYAPNGVPDFDQRQDDWGLGGPPPIQWTYCGPAAAANSLWWFDSEFEPHPASPPTTNDNYPLVQSYATMLPSWDDHDPRNVEVQTSTTQFVDDLAWYFDTDGRQTGSLHSGTVITDLYTGIEQYIEGHDLRSGYVITMVESPDFWWVAEEVEVSEDVILLLGFWQLQDLEHWVRLGGHYVTLPGVDKQGGFVAFSDPWFDRVEQTWPYAGIGPVSDWPAYVGRAADGWLIQHPITHTGVYTLHNDAGNLSHDVYRVLGTNSPGGGWGPGEYVLKPYEMGNFWAQNGGATGEPQDMPVATEVEWAVTVSPVADVFVKKVVKPSVVVPGDWVTFTIAFGNEGNDAENVVISDLLPSGLTNASYTYTLNYTGTLVGHDTFTWTVGTLRYMEYGLITVTAQVDPGQSWPAETVITNTVEINTSTQEQYQIPQNPNSASDSFTVQTADVTIAKSVAPPTLYAGEWLTYTLVYTNHGPAAAANTVITDLLHSWLVTSSYSIWTSYIGAVPVPTGYYVWPMGDVPAGGWGIIVVTAQVSPSLSGGGTLPNTASIATTTPEWDYTNNSASASNTVLYYSVDLQPDTGSITENPGQTVTYTLTLYNTGNVTDEYKITGVTTGEAWATYWPDSAGPVAGGGSAQFTVTVQISSTATTGEWSRATITATSIGNPSRSDTSVLTTTAYSGTITHGVEVAPHAAARAGHAGATVTYTLRVTNTGAVADVIELSHTDSATWTVTYSANPLSLVAGEGQDVEVYVGIPPGISGGATRVITVTATSQSEPAESDSAVLTTTVFWRFLYLPLVMRNYP